ncbi:hypothetical protein M231_00241 [Tremella mesenterica]|uniref:ATP synthase subunit K, mitochondrial n=1 Tax=Tremella mesenterica TaxID=5217 RepID=A0A4Q1BWX0_TREME|nr:hypothetical protein M231_00241 [Tremella mesenterica]
MSYVIAGKAIKNEYLALGTIFAAVGAAVVSSGGSKKSSSTIPPIAETVKSESKEEADFIQQFVAEAEKEEKKH